MEPAQLSPVLLQEKNLVSNHFIQVPEPALLSLPEKVLQFGSGALVRGLPDFFIDKANKAGIFNGRIVVVKSTETQDIHAFESQCGLFTHNVRGVEGTREIDEYVLNCSISRIIDAKNGWKEVLECAKNPQMSIIISNTTEVGILCEDGNIFGTPPDTFPAKLTGFLLERFKAFGGSKESGMVIIPTELIVDNGSTLKNKVLSLARKNKLDEGFITWLETANSFCNSLVDRIVPGCPSSEEKRETEKRLGFRDNLLIVSEPYKLWAIEGDASIKEKLSFYKADKDVVIEKNIKPFRERKLRLLNGTHTIFAALGYLSGYNTVKECLEDSLLNEFVRNVMQDEIVPALEVAREVGETFADELMFRFSNPLVEHQLSKICAHYSLKMSIRNTRTIINFYRRYIEAPRYIGLGFAGFLMFMKAEKVEGGKYYGKREEEHYLIDDVHAEYFYRKWQAADLNTINSCKLFVEDIIDDDLLWDKELKMVTGFSDVVAHSLFEIVHKGVKETIEEFVEFGEIEE